MQTEPAVCEARHAQVIGAVGKRRRIGVQQPDRVRIPAGDLANIRQFNRRIIASRIGRKRKLESTTRVLRAVLELSGETDENLARRIGGIPGQEYLRCPLGSLPVATLDTGLRRSKEHSGFFIHFPGSPVDTLAR